MISDRETLAMRKALRLAGRGRGNTFPNPMVGAVILALDGTEAGDGFHRKCGAPHAEAVAISSAGDRARGATLVVTLEPCCHQGRTGPCTDRIIDAGISRVVIAMEDPDPRVCGRGVEQLRDAGLEVQVGLMSGEAARLNRVYLHYLRTGRSWVTLKMALSLDGRIAAEDGTSRWISCEESRKTVHRKRASVGAVMTGAGTVRKDDPELTVRLTALPPAGQPARIVLTRSGDLGSSENIVRAPGRVILAYPEGAGPSMKKFRDSRKVELWEMPPDETGGVRLLSLLKRTASEGFGEILCESGPGLSTVLLLQGLADSVMIFSAPMLLGGEGRPAFGELGIRSMEKALRLENVTCRRSGSDFLTEGEFVHRTD